MSVGKLIKFYHIKEEISTTFVIIIDTGTREYIFSKRGISMNEIESSVFKEYHVDPPMQFRLTLFNLTETGNRILETKYLA